MSLFIHQRGQYGIVFGTSVLILIMVAALAWKAERILKPSQSALGAAHPQGSPALSSRIVADYGKLPISFEANQGQADKSVQFLARGSGYTLFLTPEEAILSLHSSRNGAARANTPDFHSQGALSASAGPRTGFSASVALQLIGANTSAQAAGVDPLPGKSNYFVGSDPAKWHTDVATFAKVRYSNVYPAIDLLYYGNQEGELEHDFVLAPGADPGAITIGLRGCERAVTGQAGGLSIRTGAGDLTLRSPLAYQVVGGKQKTISAAYVLASNNRIKFHLGSYDRSATLVIDPVIQYTGVFGGSDTDFGVSIAVDSAGNAYVTGTTDSTDLPLVHPLQVSGPESNGGYPTSLDRKSVV